jgi:Zn-dependent protease with chaperone function
MTRICGSSEPFPQSSGSPLWKHVVQRLAPAVMAAALFFAPAARADRTKLKPGWNLFSAQQDVEIGNKVSKDAERQLALCNDPQVDAYLNRLGKRLAEKAPTKGVQYPFLFKCVNDRAINAFALPGGFVYINRGAIEAADDEAQIAGVMAHEISHVALRHGTNQASKGAGWQLGLGALGAMMGSNMVGTLITQMGGFAANSILLKYSRTDETQADVLGTQILYDSGYDPRALAQFFEKLQEETKGKNPPEFFSNHPNPDHRIERVDEEIDKLGGPPKNYKSDSPEFHEAKKRLLAMPPPSKQPGAGASGGKRPGPASERMARYDGTGFTMEYPDNWRKNGEGNAASFTPDGGVLADSKGQAALAYGVIINMEEIHADPASATTLEDSTDQLIQNLQSANPGMKLARASERIRLNGEPGLSTSLSNDSPAGGRETDWLITVVRPDGLLYLVCVAPEAEFDQYARVCERMLDSVRFKQ